MKISFNSIFEAYLRVSLKGIHRSFLILKYFSPESVRVFKQQWRNYIKPGFFMNAGDPYSNYDLALQEDRIKDLTSGISSDALFPHTQINAMPGRILILKYF